MNDFIKKLLSRISELWAKWSMLQRLILIGIAVVVLVGIIALFRVSSTPSMIDLFDVPIRDEAALDRITFRINEENLKVRVTANGNIQVPDERTARRIRTILITENLVPSGVDPWAVFDKERWTTTDFERNVNLKRAQEKKIEEHIKSLEDIENATVNIVIPDRTLFLSDQNPVTASVTITPRRNSDIVTNRVRIKGIQQLVQFAIEGLKDENITINDNTGLRLNDFAGMEAMDRIEQTKRENKVIADLENKYRKDILASLQYTFSPDRVREINLKFDMDMSKKTVDTLEHGPIIMKPQTPGLAYDDSVWRESLTLSEKTTQITFEGSGFNPEGPAGVEGHTPPSFKDLDNLWGKSTSTERIHNQVVNRKNIVEDKSPQISRVTVSVNIDGVWKMKYGDDGKPVILADGTIAREYSPVPEADLRSAQDLIQGAIGFSAARGDMVIVRNIPYDHTSKFRDEDTAYFRKQQVQTTLLVFLSGLTILLVSFIVFRMVSREMERRRRLAEEERSRREQAIRESAIMQAEEDGVEVSISVEERSRMELMESVLSMAKEHPEDCAQLIRTWLLEE